MQLELITAEGCATVRENVGEGLLSAAYYVEWWSRRIAEHTTEQQHAASRRAYVHSLQTTSFQKGNTPVHFRAQGVCAVGCRALASQLRQCSGSAAREGDEEVLAVSTPLHLQTLQRFFPQRSSSQHKGYK